MAVPTEIRCTTCGKATTTADRFCGFCGARLDGENATPAGEITGPHRPHADRILTALRAATIGEYDVAGEIGRGGMAVVFLAHDLSLNRKVAIKALLPELLYTEGMDRRFKHEARIAAKLDHPNILVIHGVREANELLFIVMKLVEGLPLSTIAKVHGPLPIPVVRLIVRHVAEALAYAHGEGVIHRDIKPANIMVDRRGNVVVMDFGIAKAADDAHLTRTGLVIGTPAYMSPEQCLAQGVSAASDQYSLGVVAFELLTGKTPFRGSPLEMQWAHATSAPPTVRSMRPDCPPDLDALVTRMLAKAPADRWPSLHDVSHTLSDDPAIATAARATLIALASDAPGQRGTALPTTPASPLPFGPGPAAAVDATTDPVRRATSAPTPEAGATVTPNAGAVASPMLTLSQQRIELTTGDSVELIVELDATEPSSHSTPITWESSNPGVAAVSNDGYVTALAPGFAEIFCNWQGRRAVCVVQVAAAVAQPAAPAPAVLADAPRTAPAARPIAPGSQEQRTRPGEPARAPSRGNRSRMLVGVAAAGIVGAFALYQVFGAEESPSTSLTLAPSTPTTSTPAVPQPSPVPGAVAPPAAPSPRTQDSALTGTGGNTPGGAASPNATPPRAAQPGAASKAESPPPRPTASVSGAASSRTAATANATQRTTVAPAVPGVPQTRVDSARLTAKRTDTASGYGAAKSTSSTPAPTPTYAAPAAAPDSATDVIPAPSREIANALFREFANVVNNRTYSRITAAYSQPSDPAEIKLWQDFLVYVRDYTPRATVRSTTVNTSTNPPTISASIDFRWAGDAGYERTRSASFVGIGLPITDGWQLRGVRLAKKFW